MQQHTNDIPTLASLPECHGCQKVTRAAGEALQAARAGKDKLASVKLVKGMPPRLQVGSDWFVVSVPPWHERSSTATGTRITCITPAAGA